MVHKGNCWDVLSLKRRANFPLENGWLEYDGILLGFGLFSGANWLLVSGRVPKKSWKLFAASWLNRNCCKAIISEMNSIGDEDVFEFYGVFFCCRLGVWMSGKGKWRSNLGIDLKSRRD